MNVTAGDGYNDTMRNVIEQVAAGTLLAQICSTTQRRQDTKNPVKFGTKPVAPSPWLF
jgi:hypothetical protein